MYSIQLPMTHNLPVKEILRQVGQYNASRPANKQRSFRVRPITTGTIGRGMTCGYRLTPCR